MTKLIVKTIMNLMVAIMIFAFLLPLIQYPVMTIDAALAQMEASTGGYLAWTMIGSAISILRLVLYITGYCLIVGIVKDIYKFIKINIENAKE